MLKENREMRKKHIQLISDVFHKYEGEIKEEPRRIEIVAENTCCTTTTKGNGFKTNVAIFILYPGQYNKHYILGYTGDDLEGQVWKQYTPINEFDYLIEDLYFYLDKGNFRKK